jgi:hypothetical protein
MKSATRKILIKELATLFRHHPHIATKLEVNWGKEEGHRYIKNLLIKDREIRSGFDDITYQSLIRAYILHSTEYGNFNTPVTLDRPNVDLNSNDGVSQIS